MLGIRFRTFAACTVLGSFPFVGHVLAESPNAVEFNRDIRPILSDNCFRCHGPDDGQRKADLRLDAESSALGDRDGHRVIVPGDAAASELFRRISTADPADRMPPPASGKSLTAAQIETIRRWIDQGAEWQGHWAFVPPKRPNLPQVSHEQWLKNEIDAFVLARLDREGLQPRPEADRRALIRRVTLDLTGLPPTLADVHAFVNDPSPNAYERVVDRLLESPHYGEHMARFWLDAARYGDTHGLHLDNYREMWPYRDWVIGAFNRNLPFDQFTLHQLAGDLLPDATLEEQIATGFNRCHVSTNEGGSIQEEVYVRNVVDRVETTGTVFLGLTVGCAVCHDHKFDPISQKDFYRLFAFFNSLDGSPLDGNRKDPAPVVKVLTRDEERRLAAIRNVIDDLREQRDAPRAEVDAAQREWEATTAETLRSQWHVLAPTEMLSSGGASLERLPDGSVLVGGKNTPKDTLRIVARTDRQAIQGLRLEALSHDSLANDSTGRSDNGNFVLSEIEVDAISAADPKQRRQVRFVEARADYSQNDYDVAKAIDGRSDTGWAVDGHTKRESRTAWFVPTEPFGFDGGTELHVALRHESTFDRHVIGRFRLAVTSDTDAIGALRPVTLSAWHSLGPFATANLDEAHDTAFGPEADLADRSGAVDLEAVYNEDALKWTPQPDWKDGEVHNTLEGEYAATYLYRSIEAPTARRVTLSLGSDDSVSVWLNGRTVLQRKVTRGAAADQETLVAELDAGTNHLLMKVCNSGGTYGFYFRKADEDAGLVPADIARALLASAESRGASERARLRDFYRSAHWPEWRDLQREMAELEKQAKQIEDAAATTLVFKERAEPRPAFVLRRGQYDLRGDPVERATPEALPPMPEDLPRDRLGLARWLLDPSHPLTARVAVNRFWQQFFGTGIVKTAEDFGSQGEVPSHPQLLDYLATQFVADGWDVKAMIKRIAMSATYRQSSAADPALYARDPENRLLARGPRFRLDAEVMRDQALALSSLLVGKVGGTSVKPPQPDGLWFAVGYSGSNTVRFKSDDGERVYRRSVYTFLKRTAPPPVMRTFDAPSRESCQVRRERTNTPLQALVLLNETQFIEAARALARRILREGGETARERAAYAFELVTARPPNDFELSDLLGVLESHRVEFANNADAGAALAGIEDAARTQSGEPATLAAWTMVANLLLNLDEVITKG